MVELCCTWVFLTCSLHAHEFLHHVISAWVFPSSCRARNFFQDATSFFNKSRQNGWTLAVQQFTHCVLSWLERFVRMHQSVIEFASQDTFFLRYPGEQGFGCRRISPFERARSFCSQPLTPSTLWKALPNQPPEPSLSIFKEVRSYHHLKIGLGLGDHWVIWMRSSRSGMLHVWAHCVLLSMKCKHRFPVLEKRGILSKLCNQHSLITFLFLFFGLLWGTRPCEMLFRASAIESQIYCSR